MFDPADSPSRDTDHLEPASGTACDLCKGTGWETRTDNDCTDCNGTGRYITTADRRAMWAAYDAKRKQESR